MTSQPDELPPPVNHIFVDCENVREVDPAVFGDKTVHVTLLLGPQKAKLDVTLVEKLLQHAANVEFIRLTSPGRNALDFALAYYLGRAVLADPGGYFHLVSKDTGYNPLIEHLRTKRIRIRRHADFAALTLPAAPNPAEPIASPTAKHPVLTPNPEPKPETDLNKLEEKVLEHLRKPTTKRPGTHKKLISYLVAHLGKKRTEAEITNLIALLGRAGHLVVDDKGKINYHLSP
ncbi:MAG TPA: PIN domain-containing protein [Verrucomicrobiae bacterium]|nr:PIN domain-containing protein [Verrucomicrobiae bacterium]